jgi:hypothetical protein
MHTNPIPILRSRESFARLIGLLWCVALLTSGAAFGQGQSQPTVMHTGGGQPLTSQSIIYTSIPGTSGGATAIIDFGFATQEQPRPGLFADSFTISITGPDGTGYLVTIDANGTKWAPLVTGALPVLASSIQRQTSPFLVPTEGLPNTASYVMGYTLPANWQGVPLTVNFDLFDNQDALRSLAYFDVPAQVPEPSCVALLALGLVLRRYRNRARA